MPCRAFEGRIRAGAYAVAPRLFCDLQGAAVAQNDALDIFGDGHDLVDADTALVAVIAGRTADGL